MTGKVRGRRVSGIDRAFQILDYLTERGSAATAYDIASAIKAPNSTVYEIVEGLIEKRALLRDERGQVFLGPKLHFYGLAYSRDLNLASVLQQAMDRLARSSGETVQICGRDDDKMVVEMMQEGDDHFQVSSRVGTRVPWNWTASGHLLVGYLPQPDRSRLIARAQPSPTGMAETDPERLEERCIQARSRRLAVQINESRFSVACIAAPIIAPGGRCVVTISLVVPEIRAKKAGADFSVKVRAAAAEVERAMGWEVPAPDLAEVSAQRRLEESLSSDPKAKRGARPDTSWMDRL